MPSEPAVIFIAPIQTKICPRQVGGEYSLRAASVAAKKAALNIPVMKKHTNTDKKLLTTNMENSPAIPDDELTLTRMAYFSEHGLALISAHRKPASRFGFAVLLCYLKNVGFAPDKKIPPSDALLKHIASRLKLTGDLWPAYLSGRDTTRREHLTELYRILA